MMPFVKLESLATTRIMEEKENIIIGFSAWSAYS
jgi:hypothetical protein